MHQPTARPVDGVGQEPTYRPLASPSAEAAETGIEPGSILSLPRVLARIPDLDAIESGFASEPSPTSSRARLISQGLSTKLLLGGTFLLVLAAIVPWSTRKNVDATPPETEAPLWHSPATTAAPAVVAAPATTAAPVVAGRTPHLSGQAGEMPKAPPGGIGNLPSTGVPSGPAGVQFGGPPRVPAGNPQPQVSLGNNAVPPPEAKQTSGPAIGDPLGFDRGRYEASRPSPGYYRQQPFPEAVSNRPMVIGEPAQTPPQPSYRTSEPGDSRIDPRWGDPPAARADSQRDQGSYRQPRGGDRYPVGLADRRMPLPPPAGNGATSLPAGEPGVAAFKGSIETPPVRPQYERP